jgi:membrane protein
MLMLRQSVAFVRGVIGRLTGVGTARAAAALSFQTMLAVVPLFTVAFVYVARYPLFQQFLDALERFALRHMLPGSTSAVRGLLTEFTAKAATLQGISIAMVVVTAMLMVGTVEREFNAIFRVRVPRSLIRRIPVYALGLTAGPVAIGAAVFATSWLIEATVEQVPFVLAAVPFVALIFAGAITTVTFTLLYAILPARHVPLRSALAGGLFVALAFEVAKYGFRVYIKTVPTYQIVYGTLAALPLFLIWIYVVWIIVLIGAAIVATLSDGRARGSARPRAR